MGGKSRKSGQVSKRLIERLKQNMEKSCNPGKVRSDLPELLGGDSHEQKRRS